MKPERDCEYGSFYNEDKKREVVIMYCPECKQTNEVTWGDIERGATNKCEFCGYEWVNGKVAPR